MTTNPLAQAAAPATGVNPQALVYYKQAVLAETENAPTETTESYYRRALGLAPNHPLILIRLASLLSHTGRPREAATLYERARQILPADPMIPVSLGALYEQAGDLPTAQYYYQMPFQQDSQQAPEYTYGLLNLARVQALQGQLPMALAAYSAVLTQYPEHWDAQRYRAYLLLEMGMAHESAEAFESLRQRSPERFTDTIALAKSLTRSNQAQAALTLLQSTPNPKTNRLDSALAEAEARISLGQIDDAAKAYQKAIQADPTNDQLLISLADVYAAHKRWREAGNTLQRYLAKHPAETAIRTRYANTLLEAKQYAAAITEFQYLLAQPKPAPSDLQRFTWQKQLAYAYQLSNQPKLALEVYDRLLSQPPFSAKASEDWVLLKNRAIAAHQAGDLTVAANGYRQLYREIPRFQRLSDNNGTHNVSLSPDDIEALRQDLLGVLKELGEIAYEKQQFDEAKAYFDEATQLTRMTDNPGDARNLLLAKANADLASGKLDEARAVYDTILAEDPAHPIAGLYLAKIDLQQVKNDDPAIAKPVTEGVIERLNTLNAQADFPAAERLNLLTTLAEAYSLPGQDPAQAPGTLAQLKKTYEAMLAIEPNLLYALLGLGQTEHQLGNLKAALGVYQRAAAHYPTNAVVFYNLGTVYHAQGSAPQAVAAYQKALQLDDTMAESRYGLAVIWESQQRFSEAVANYQAYVKARPDGPYAKTAQERAAALANR